MKISLDDKPHVRNYLTKVFDFKIYSVSERSIYIDPFDTGNERIATCVNKSIHISDADEQEHKRVADAIQLLVDYIREHDYRTVKELYLYYYEFNELQDTTVFSFHYE